MRPLVWIASFALVGCSPAPKPIAPVVADKDAAIEETASVSIDDAGIDVSEASVAPARPPLGSVVQIALGGNHSCALLDDATVKCWGKNEQGQLGDGSSTSSSVPVGVKGLASVAEVAAGARHTCARLKDGTAACWGWNNDGAVGDGTTSPANAPVAIKGLKNVTQLSLGSAHTCALLADKTVRCFGLNHAGQVGDGTTLARHIPTLVTGLNNVVQIEARGFHTCARLASGAVSCWGSNREGELCDGVTVNVPTTGSGPAWVAIGRDRSTPANIAGATNVVDLALGGMQTCMRRSDGKIACCGLNSQHSLGSDTFLRAPTPVVIDSWKGVSKMGLGAGHTCALVSGTVRCAGASSLKQLGVPMPIGEMSPTPLEVPGLGEVVELSVGAFHTCVRLSSGNVRCWGANGDGQLGDGTTSKSSMSVTVVR